MRAIRNGLDSSGAAPLGSYASRVSPPGESTGCGAMGSANKGRGLRMRLQRTARRYAQSLNQQNCGRLPLPGGVDLVIRNGKAARFKGLLRCGSVWVCPVCAYCIGGQRCQEVEQVVRAHMEAGGGVCFVTLTLPHDQGDRLRPLKDAVTDSWRSVISGAPWIHMKDRIGCVGYVKALEATIGEAGWHPHLHVLLFTSGLLSEAQLRDLKGFLYRRWSNAVENRGYRRPSPERGVDVRRGGVDAGAYVAKLGLAAELVGGITKEGRQGRRTPMQLLSDLDEYGAPQDSLLWQEWVKAMHGARQLTWSKGFRDRYPSEASHKDTEIVADQPGPGDVDEVVEHFTAAEWWKIVNEPDLPAALLEVAEAMARRGELDRAAERVRSLVAGVRGRAPPRALGVVGIGW